MFSRSPLASAGLRRIALARGERLNGFIFLGGRRLVLRFRRMNDLGHRLERVLHRMGDGRDVLRIAGHHGAAQEGGSTVAECMATAGRVDFSDDMSWYRAWTRTAESSDERAIVALCNGNVVTARSNWLRAMNYYQAAALPFDSSDETYQTAIEMPVRDQPIASDMGWRKILSESIAPNPMQVTTKPAPTMRTLGGGMVPR